MEHAGHPEPAYLDMALRNGIEIPARFLAPIYAVSEATIARWCEQGIIPSYKHQNGQWFVKTRALTGAELENAKNEERNGISRPERIEIPRSLESQRQRRLRPSP